MQIAEITRHETSERAALLTVDSYAVHLDLTRGDKVFGSTSIIVFDCAEPGAATYADLIAETVDEITLNGSPIDPAIACADGRIALQGLAGRNELRVIAECRYATDAKGMHRAVDSADGNVYCYTNCEPADARRVFATFEQPDLKATVTFRVTAPAHWVVLSNQPAPEPEPAGDGIAVWQFAPTPRISTYLTAIVAGEYHLVRDTHTTPQGQVIPLGLACRASLAPYLEAADMFTITRQGLDYYTRLFESGYPFAKYDQVFVPEFSAGAMENVGCVTFSERMLFRSKVTDLMYELRATVILHEMAHMWFGDLVTMKWWDDLWLNESFADFSAALSSAEATRFRDAWTTFCASRKTWGYRQDQLPTTHPIAADVATLSEAISNFDGISYAKGASVLKQLVAYVGRDNFFAGIRAYFARHSWGNATLADLLRALEASSGLELGDWAKSWLLTAGPNTLRAEFSAGSDGRFTEFAVLQEAPAEHPTLRPHHIAVGLYNLTADSGSLLRTHRVAVDVAGPHTEVPALVGLQQPDLILLNDDDLGYALVRFDERSLTTVSQWIGALDDSLARAVCWSVVLDMVQHAELSVPAYIQILARGMGREPSVSMLQSLHLAASRLMAATADPHWLPEGKEQLATAALALLKTAEPGSDHQLAWVQLLTWTAVTPAQLDFLADLLGGKTVPAGLVVDTELRWALLRRLAAMGRAGDAEVDAELARDPTDAGRRHAAASRASIPDPEHKEAAWQLLAQSGELGHEGVLAVAAAFGQPEHARLLGGYVEAYFAALPDIWETRGDHMRRLLGDVLFPYAVASPDLLSRIDEFLAAERRPPSMVRVLVERRDMVEKALRSRALPN